MYLGKLAVYAMDGLFCADHLFYAERTFEQKESSYMGYISAVENDFDLIPTKHEFTPVDVNGDTEYITGTITNSEEGVYDTKVTLWLLVEEEMDVVIENEYDE